MSSSPPAGRLFRAEAVAEQGNAWLGRVILTPRISHSLFVAFAALMVGAVLCLFAFGEYTRKARIAGTLAPERGMIHVVAPQPGVLIRIHVTEGDVVAAGDPLAVLSAERLSQEFGATQGEVVRALQARRSSLAVEPARLRALFAQQAATLESRLEVLATESRDLARALELQGERRDLSERALERERDLRARNIALEESLLAAERDALEQAMALQALERGRTEIDRNRLEVEAALKELPLLEQQKLAELEREIAALDADLAAAEAAREVIITAPQDGIVTGLRYASGSSIGSDGLLMNLIPEGSHLEARLDGPSRDVGFLRPGQRVRMRFEAFPYQKFGQYEGVVSSVSRATLSPEAMDASGRTATEPVYRVTVELASQSAMAYGEAVPLQPGMRLEADVLIETRRLYEWVLDPLRTLAGRAREGSAV